MPEDSRLQGHLKFAFGAKIAGSIPAKGMYVCFRHLIGLVPQNVGRGSALGGR
jgi:hypothetical protein